MTEKPRETQAESHVVELKEKVNNSSLMKHPIWGLRTESADESSAGRHLIGKSVITSLSPGRELSELSRSRGDLLSRIRSFTLLGEQ